MKEHEIQAIAAIEALAKLGDPLLFQNNKKDGGKSNFLGGVIRRVGNIR